MHGEVRIIKVIVAQNATTGKGKEGDPIRRLFQLYTLAGELIVDIDPHGPDLKSAVLRSFHFGAIEEA